MDLAALQSLDRQHFLHPFTDHRALAARGSRMIVRGEGVYIYDSEGRRILDAMSGLWCINLGYGRQELIDAATRQLQVLPYYNSFFQCTHPPAVNLATRLAELAPPGLRHVFFTNSGSEANDTVIRLVRRYWDLRGEPQRKFIISRRNAYHGSTVGAASLGGMSAQHAQGDLPIPGIVHVEQPYGFELQAGRTQDEFMRALAADLEAKILEIGPSRVAAFIGEPVQGAGGVIIPPRSYWAAMEAICRRHGMLLVADEVITAFGRLGEWFGCSAMGFVPDLLVFAKAITGGYLPLGGVLVNAAVAEVLIDRGGEFFHGFTHSGNPTACAVALAALEILQSEQIITRVREDTAPYFQRRWQALGEHPLVGEARAIGLMGALELVADKHSRRRFAFAPPLGERCRNLAFDQGVVMRHVRDSLIVAPPLVVSRAQIDEMVDKAWQVLDLAAREIGIFA